VSLELALKALVGLARDTGRTGRFGDGFAWPRYCCRAYVRGRRAARLVSEPIEEMLQLPIDEARRRLRIAPTESVHPEGIRRGYRRDGALGAVRA
jgi:hypothetical protein